MNSIKIVTIGVYGYSETEFFNKLLAANVDTFVDIRRRRGVRGSLYAFTNSVRLQNQLARLSIQYRYFLELAPTQEIRMVQKKADKVANIQKRHRSTLNQEFVEKFKSLVLANYDPKKFFEQLPPSAKVVALFCVEKEPEACHRSIVAEWLKQYYHLEVEHLIP